jgi:amino acid adenylation domain-containing protein/FkbM family methyltransferase
MKRSFKLSAEQRRALQEELRSKGVAVTNETIPVRGDRSEHPLSFGQQRLWFLDQLAPGGTAYNMPSGVRFRGPLEIAVLLRACAEILRRHEALRAAFPARHGEPYQVVAPSGALSLPLVDLSALPLERRLGEAEERGRREAGRPFDLQTGPLLRAALFRLDREDHVALFVLHHIIGDGRSSEILVRELGMLYAAFSQGLPSPLPELPIQYADFAAWQQERLTGERLEELLAWWRKELAGAPEELGLPTDHPRREGHRRNARAVHEIPPHLHAAIAALGQRGEATPFMVYLAALTALLHVYTGRQDLIVGTPVLGRERAETADVIGFFVNTLALRSQPAGDPAFSEHLARLRATVLGALHHQELPFERLIEDLRPERHPGRSPLIDLMFLLEGVNAFQIPGLTAEPFEMAGGEAKLDLVLAVRAVGERMWLAAEYDAALFEAATIQRLLRHFEALLAAVAADPDLPLSQHALLTAGEQQQILREWNPPQLPVGASVPELVAHWARETPQAQAGVDAEGRSMTYGELRDRAEGLARHLRRLGVAPDSLVGVCLERSLDTLTALTAVLWAGGAYLPLDPDYPEERLRWQLEDSRASVLITRREMLDRCRASMPHIILLDEEKEEPQRGESFALRPPAPAGLVYVVYTSGSTGRPKGVCVTHAGLADRMMWARERFQMTAADRSTLLSAPGFDASVLEIWTALTAGASLYVPPVEVRSAPGPMVRWLAASGVTVSFLPTPLTDAVLAEVDFGAADLQDLALRVVTTGGDRLQRRPTAAAGFELINLYGPTEITMMASAGRVDPAGSGAPSIGRPIPGAAIYLVGGLVGGLVDGALSPVPAGVVGEMLLGGRGVARGYLGRPELTAERFLPDPFSGEPGARLYRTGDLARWTPAGQIEFVGRRDHQVKIRGYRIELGEIEAALARHPGVREAVALALGEGEDRRLVAWVVPTSEVPSIEELRSFLRRSLPEPMVPSAWVFLESLPLTEHGKVDRRTLARTAPEVETPAGEAPRTPVEEIVAGIWAEVLQVSTVRRDDDFFARGGHSLLATRVVSRLRAAFGVDLPLRALFEEPTVARLAAAVEALHRQSLGEAASLPLVRVTRSENLPLSFSQQRLWFLDQLQPGSAAYNIPAALRLTGRLDPSALAGVFTEIVRRHETLRTTFPSLDGEPVQRIAAPAPLPLPVLDLSGLPEDRAQAEAVRLAEAEAQRPFDLAAGPLFRTTLLRLGAEEHVLLGSMHHIVSDAWSVGVLVREVAALYADAAARRPSSLPELPVQYADFAVWQRRRLAGEALEAELAFWRARLAGAPPDLELPADRPRPPLRTDRGGSRRWQVPAGLEERLHSAARGLGATRFMVLLAAFQALLGRLTGHLDVSVGSPVAGRPRPEVEGLIGLFLNTLVLRTDLSGEPGFAALVARVRETCLQAFAHQDLPFERLVEELAPGRHLGQTPLFQVAFAFQKDEAGPLALPGLAMAPVPVAERAAKFDLTLSLLEGDAGLSGALSYSSDLFDGTTAERLLDHLERLLAGALAEPERRFSDLPLLAETERQQVLVEWNDTRTAGPGEALLHRWIEAQVERTPDAVAVEIATESLTYRELDERANRLARHLRGLGAGLESRVGVCAERSLELMVGLLAVLKAGCAYVPLDPEYPRERLSYMLGDSRVAVLLTQERLLGVLPEHEVPTVVLDRGAPLLTSPLSQPPPSQGGGTVESLAYVIYTSGSTGRPKGAMNTHRAICNRLQWMQAAYGLGPDDRVMQKTPVSFDVSVWELFWPLMTGARLVLALPGGHRDAGYLARLIAERGVTTMHFVPSMLQVFLEEPGLEELCGPLKRVIASGEALAAEHQERFFLRLGALGTELHNLYGPTEAAVDVTFWACSPSAGRRAVPIGRPIANCEIHLLDREMRPVPIGVPGHLHIGGIGLARGYLARPELTAERFVPSPFGPAGARLYATGDLARHLPDGAIDFLGRIDHQLKLRGFRIELGEVEAVLREHPALSDAVAVVREASAGDRRLVAYAVPDPDRAAPVRRLLHLQSEGRLAGMDRYELPNGMAIVHRNRSETEFVYRETFEEASYLRHGVELHPGDCVLDVGANIGMFTLFVGRTCPGARVYAFEPVPQLFELLRANAEIHGVEARPFLCGLGEKEGHVAFTYYPHVSIVSGRYADAEQEREVLAAYERGRTAEEGSEALLDELLADRMAAEVIDCELRTLSGVLRDEGIEKVDLLKIDVEKSEKDVLDGIAEEDWAKIRQVVIEVHDLDGRIAWVSELLAGKGYEVAVEQEAELQSTPIATVYAVRTPHPPTPSPIPSPRPGEGETLWASPARLAAELRESLAAKLPEFMVPSALVLLEKLPLSPNGKVERSALPAPEWESGESYVAPRTATEELLAGLWEELLGKERVGARDDFFALGGHSLLATRLVARIRAAFGVDLAVRRVFEAPTLGALAAAIDRESMQRGAQEPELVPAARDGAVLPLSFAQERLWFLDRLEPGNPTFDMPAAVDLAGGLRIEAVAGALAEVARRHESLRTTFGVRNGVPFQRIAPPSAAALIVVDLSALPEAARQREAAGLAGQHAHLAFDLEHGPVYQAALLRLAPDHHRLLFNIHHIVADGWSIGVLLREFSAAYTALVEGRVPSLPPLPVQVPDFAVWQRQWLAAREAEELGYWLERLGGEIAPLDLPVDRPRPAVQTFSGGRSLRMLAPELSDRLRAFSRGQGATLFMTLLAGTQALLSRLAGQDDVTVGTPVAGRRRVEVEGLIGCFLNTLVLRTDFSGTPGLRELLGRVREVTLGAFSHQDVPFEALLARLGVERDLSRTPLFQVFFNLLNLPPSELRLPGLTAEGLSTPEPASKFDMTFYVRDNAAGIAFDLVYNADLFDAVRMDELLAQLELLLTQAVERPEEPLAHLSLVTGQAAAVLPDPTEPLDGSWIGAVHELFAANARKAPERPAVVGREGVWSYGDLDEAVGRLAAWLAAHGVGRGDRVAIYAHRSAPIVQAVLGALTAGAAFVMLDPAYPAPRLLEFLEPAAPSAWLQLAAAGPLPAALEAWLAETGCPRFVLPQGGPAEALAALAEHAGDRPEIAVGPDDLACLTFTSGSTGKPKGVLARHGPLSHFLPWQCARFGMYAEDRFSLLSGLAHDPLQRDIFTPLYLGAALCVPDPEATAAGRLSEWLERAGVTVSHLTPAMAQVLTEPPAGGAAVLAPRLRLVLLVGDALTRLDVARIRRLAPGATCVNLYGSTETQRAVAFHVAEAREDDDRSKQVLPLGRGMQDAQLLVLNPAGRLAGIGEVGEIAIRSPHLALGYLGDPVLSAAKFPLNPFTGAAGDRIYRTGDLGRYLPNGEVVFAGRADLQVKIRGFRIEPAEIEAALAGLPGVREAIVLARDKQGEKRLAAYVVPKRGEEVAIPALRAGLRDRLPAHMVPADFILLERLPLNPNGKVDRRALAALTTPEEARPSAAPVRSDLERRIAAAWREVLGTEEIGADENFFDAGGHSLLLVRLHSRLEEILGRAIPLVELFGHPTIRAQAERFAGATPASPTRDARPRSPVGGHGRIAVIGMAGRFPEAPDLDRFWENLRDGVEGISRFSDDELAAAGISAERARGPRTVRSRGKLADIDLFDAEFFAVPPQEAEIMDPQLRLFLECAWQALENAGCDPERIPGAVGVYAGMSLSSYFLGHLLTRPDLLATMGEEQTIRAFDRDYLTTQASYKLGLKGPSLTVQTACSTSLVAVHYACQALLAGECDTALAGGVSVKIPQVVAAPYEEGGIDSLSGHCRAFDAGADGTVWGNGVGLVVLKRLEDALADGDPIRAVILGSAINNDGAHKVGFTAPSIEGQAEVISAAQARAEISPDTVTYIEAHGTGTPLGDPIEVAALTRAFRPGTERNGFCALGSVKTNIGHLGAAAGVAGLIKAVLALEHRQIPPSLGFATPNPAIPFAASPFYVQTQLADWPRSETPRRAGVSSFGMGGTNAHVVLEEPPSPAPAEPSRTWQLLTLSARSEAALEAAAGRLADWLDRHADADLADIAWTLQTGRRAFPCRRIVLCRDVEEARQALRGRDPHRPEGEGEDGRSALLEAGHLWLAGGAVDWQAVHAGERRRRIPLPTYPFERRRYWIEPGIDPGHAAAPASREDREPLDAPVWRPAPLPAAAPESGPERWLLFADASGLAARLAGKLTTRGSETVLVSPESAMDTLHLLRDLETSGRLPRRIAHLGSVAADGTVGLLALAEALGEMPGDFQIAVISTHLHDLGGEEPLPEKEKLLAACAAISTAHPRLACRSLDVPPPGTPEALDRLATLLSEDLAHGTEPVIAYTPRGKRWARHAAPERLRAASSRAPFEVITA